MKSIGSLFTSLFRKQAVGPKVPVNNKLLSDLNVVINSMRMPSAEDDGTQLGKSYTDFVSYLGNEADPKRRDNYALYAKMDDTDPIISAVLNIYADEITMGTHEGDITRTFSVVSDDPTIQAFLEHMTDLLQLKSRIRPMARDLVKYGDVFDELVFNENHIIKELVNLPPESMAVNRNDSGQFIDREKAYVQQFSGIRDDGIYFPWWKIAHTKWIQSPRETYGSSLLRPVRKLYHQIRAVLDGAVIERVLRAPQRLKYKIDTGNVDPDKAIDIVQKYKDTNRRKRVVDSYGTFRFENTPMAPEEDIYVPVGPDGHGDVEVMQGSQQTKNVDDIQFLINMYIAATGTPKAYLAFEGESHNRNVITQLDIHHARLVRAYQGDLITTLRFIYDIALSAIGVAPDKVTYRIVFPMIRTEDDLRKWQIINLKTRVGFMLRTQVGVQITDDWIMRKLLDIPEDELEMIGYDPENVSPPGMPGSPTDTSGTTLPAETVRRIQDVIRSGKDPQLVQTVTDLYELLDSKLNYIGNDRGVTRLDGVPNLNGKSRTVAE